MKLALSSDHKSHQRLRHVTASTRSRNPPQQQPGPPGEYLSRHGTNTRPWGCGKDPGRKRGPRHPNVPRSEVASPIPRATGPPAGVLVVVRTGALPLLVGVLRRVGRVGEQPANGLGPLLVGQRQAGEHDDGFGKR